jgi:surface antigen
MGVMSLAPASHADDDYPYRGLGQCPLVPLPKPKPTPPGQDKPHGPSRPTKPGSTHGHGHDVPPDKPGTNGPGNAGTPTTPPPPRECAKHIWYYQGSYGDPWGFALRNCTSFVAWALRERNGLADFTNHMDGGSFGNAERWDANAAALGYLVDDVPAVGAVAQTDDGRIGHVAWVSAVGEGTVTVEEYNYDVAGGYDVRTVPTSTFRYLHLDDIAPAPWQGTTRTAASVLDVQGRPWWARTTSAGDLLLGGPVGRPVRLGVPGSWTAQAAPALGTDALGRTWVAAVTRTGGLFTAHSLNGERWSRPRSLGSGWATTSSPALALDGHRRLHLLAVTATGTLTERVATRDRWHQGSRMSGSGPWATHSSPAAVTDADGHVWLAAVTHGGTLLLRHQHGRSGTWGRVEPLGGGWSVSAAPALARAADGRLWLAAVTSHGGLSVRSTTDGRWHSTSSGGDGWSPYSSPSLAADPSGRMWLAAERAGGQVVLRSTRAHETRWQPGTALGRASETASTAVVPLPVGGVRVGALTQDAQQRWWTVGLPRTSMAGLSGARGGGFSASLWLRMP